MRIFTIFVFLVSFLVGNSTEAKATTPVNDTCLDFTVPNIFTPNGDGRNDFFYVNPGTAEYYYIGIYDRWGNLEFVSYSPNISWDGRTSGGVEASAGVYYYVVKSICGGVEKDKHGFLQLIR